jgi:hypothetical protein
MMHNKKGPLGPLLTLISRWSAQAKRRQHERKVLEAMVASRRSYTIADDGKSITCHRCGKTSYHIEDVRHRYCGHCHIFHDDMERGL